MSKDKKRLKQTIKFLKWIKKYNGWWQLICEPNNEHMNLDMMQSLIKRLEKESFYEIIFVMLTVHKKEEFMKGVNNALLNDLIINEWKNGHKDEMVKKLLYYLE